MDIKQIVSSHLQTAIQVFVATFLVTAGLMLKESGQIVWSGAFFYPILIAAVTSGMKEVAARLFSVKFGGRVGPTLFGSRKA